MTMLERGVVEYQTFSGVTLLVTPLSIATITAIIERAKVEYPDFDDRPFRVEIPHSAVPDATVLDVDNPDYQRLRGELEARRNQYIDHKFYELGIEIAGKKADVLKVFKDRITQLREVLGLTDSDEHILLFHIALARTDDLKTVTAIIRDRVPLTEGEVADGLRIFRPDLQRNGLLRATRSAPRLPAESGQDTGDVVEP